MRSETCLKSISFCAAIVFLFSSYAMAGTWTTLNAPGAYGTSLMGIDGSNIVGYYSDTYGRQHGGIYNGTTWTTLDEPSGYYTEVDGIDGSNLVGTYSSSHGFLYNGTTWTTLDAPLGE